jgi:hypothetical protein
MMEDLPIENINSKIYEIREEKVMLDSDLASLYGITTGNLNKAVSRNLERFPSDFMFELSKEEYNLIFQNGISSYGGRRKLPRVFTEQGVAMISSVIKSKTAININIQIMRMFVEMRRFALTYDELAKKIQEIESRVTDGEKRDQQIINILNQLMAKDESKLDKIGFIKD